MIDSEWMALVVWVWFDGPCALSGTESGVTCSVAGPWLSKLLLAVACLHIVITLWTCDKACQVLTRYSM